jgi:hypothetical protein
MTRCGGRAVPFSKMIRKHVGLLSCNIPLSPSRSIMSPDPSVTTRPGFCPSHVEDFPSRAAMTRILNPEHPFPHPHSHPGRSAATLDSSSVLCQCRTTGYGGPVRHICRALGSVILLSDIVSSSRGIDSMGLCLIQEGVYCAPRIHPRRDQEIDWEAPLEANSLPYPRQI